MNIALPTFAVRRPLFEKDLADYRKKMEANIKVQRAQRMLDAPGEPRQVTFLPLSYELLRAEATKI